MRAVLITIDLKSRDAITTDIVIGAGDEDIVNAIGNRCADLTNAGYITDPETNIEHAVFVDFSALSKPNLPVSEVSWHDTPLAGNIVVTGINPDSGDTIPATISGEHLQGMIKRPAFAYTGRVH